MWRRSSLALLAASAALCALEVPAGTEVQIRLKTRISSSTAKPKSPVEFTVIAPVLVSGQFVIPAGAAVRAIVAEAKPSTKPDERAVLGLSFTEIEAGGVTSKLPAKVSDLDNARESVDENGQILGIIATETISGRMDAGLGRLAERASGLAGILEAAKGAVLKAAESDIAYEPGVEMTIKLTAPLDWKGKTGDSGIPALQPVAAEDELASVAAKQPFQTMAEKPSKPSDMTNLMFIGSEEQMRGAFTAAGWSTAAALTSQSKMETFKAIAELRGYKEAPVSILLLEGHPPDFVFQKQNNTFAQRHHLRIWRRPVTFQEKPVWVCAATHDIGIDFSQENRTFIHKIDPEIDRERAKVTSDLLLTGQVKSLALVDRPDVPKESQNATGDKLITDGHIAVLIF